MTGRRHQVVTETAHRVRHHVVRLATGEPCSIVAGTLIEQGVSIPVLAIAFDQRWIQPALLADVPVHEEPTLDSIARRIEDRIAQPTKRAAHHAE